MAFETSNVAGQVATPAGATNPLQMLEGLAELQNRLNVNQFFQAKSLAGRYLEQATGPDGQTDFNQFTAALRSDPRTSVYAPEILQGVATLRQTGIANQQSQTNLSQSQYNNLRNDAATAGVTSTADDPEVRATQNQRAVASAIARGVASGRYPADMASEFMGNGGFQDAIRAAVISGEGGTGAQTALTGTPTTINNGATQKTVTINPYTHEVEPMSGSAATIVNQLSPEAEATPRVGINPVTGKPFSVPTSAVVTPTGQPKVVSGLTGPHGEVQTGLAPGESEQLGLPLKNAGEQAADLQTAYAGSAAREALLKEALAAQGNFRSGPGAGKWSQFVTEANRLLPGLNIAPNSTPSQQVFSKIVSQLSAAQRGALGLAPTNEQIALAGLTTPNNEISPEANLRVAAIQLGNEKLIQKKEQAWEWYQQRARAKGQIPNYVDFQNQFNPLFDPRFFQEEFMTKGQKQELYDSMSAAERKRYESARARANSLNFGQ